MNVVSVEGLRERGELIRRVAAGHGASNVRVFGSVARGQADERSDIDLLVDFEPGRSLFDLVRLADELEGLLGRKVDIVTEDELRPRNRQRLLSEAQVL